MSKSLHSPTARLLQSSRLFSLPRPLPVPAQDQGQVQVGALYKASDTATLPYPVRQAIATPASSHHRGDWGLKRAIPRRTTARSSTPVIRVRAQDNPEHITDFESAADHVLTEAKWRQMSIPLMTREQRKTLSADKVPSRSVYDDEIDSTDPAGAVQFGTSHTRSSAVTLGTTEPKQRWKYEGPYIPGMEESEFQDYVTRNLAKRKGEFRVFLLQRMVEKRIREEQAYNRDRGVGGALSAARVKELRVEAEQDYDAEEKRMRDAHVHMHLGSELTAAICDFLDLPGVIAHTTTGRYAKTSVLQTQINALMKDAGPPSTHPAAGLSHVRSNAYMENHPYWGPQANRTPVKARVLRPRRSSAYNEEQVKLGVGGVVTADPVIMSHSVRDRSTSGYSEEEREERYLDATAMGSSLDENLPGGNKFWVQPEHARIDEAGRIRLEISRGAQEAIAVKRNKVELIHEARRRGSTGIYSGVGWNLPRANYGVGFPDMRWGARETSQGFDEELGREPRQGPMGGAQAARHIQELMGKETRRI